MTLFHFSAVSFHNKTETGQVDAADAIDAKRRLLDRGLIPLSIHSNGRSLLSILQTPIGGNKIPGRQAAQLLADLAHLSAAGVEVAEALGIIEASSNRAVRPHLSRLHEAVRAGGALSDALATEAAFPHYTVTVIRAGELSGSLPSALHRVAADMSRADQIHKELWTALIYPACVVAAAIAAISVLFFVVVPSLRTLFADATNRLPWQTQLLIVASDGLRAHWPALFVLLAMAGGAIVTCVRTASTRAIIEQITLNTPVLGPVLKAGETARIARLLSVFTAAKLPMPTAVGLTADGGRLVRSQSALRHAAQRVREGATLSQALADVPALSSRLLELIKIGQQTGRLPEMLDEAARGAEQAVRTAIDRMLALLTPAITVIFGAGAGFVLYSIMTAILSVNDLALSGH